MKRIMIVWGLIAIILVGGLTYVGFNIKKINEPYIKLEKELERNAIALVGEKPAIIGDNNKILLQTFIDNGYKINTNINDDVCDGYVIVEKNLSFYKYVPYLKCKKYQTKGYEKN